MFRNAAHMETLSLPVQLIHADLHYDNVLVHEERVSGLLDFEFSVHDWRGRWSGIYNSKYADINMMICGNVLYLYT